MCGRQLGISCTDNCNCEKNDVPCRNIKEIVTTADDHETREDAIDNDIEMNNGIIDMRDESFNFYHDSECESDSDIYLVQSQIIDL